jgi:methylated-DNA-[protein]-cysteine S-methyltransferase
MLPQFTTIYASPIGELTLVATDTALCGVYFENHQPAPLREHWQVGDASAFTPTKRWLDAYFTSQPLPALPSISFLHGTEFQRAVWQQLGKIPAGTTQTYVALAHILGRPNASRAVGAAVGRNPISILNPCHRVVGSNGSLTGFAGGVERKRFLLALEDPTLL